MAKPPQAVLPIVWGAFVSSHALFVAISFFVPADPSLDPGMVSLFGIPALALAGIAAEGSLVARVAPQLQTWFILRYALAEAAGLMGFAAYFASGDHLVQLACAGAGLLAHLAAYPSGRAIELHGEMAKR